MGWLKRAYYRHKAHAADRVALTHGRAMVVALARMDWPKVDLFAERVRECGDERAKWLEKAEACK